MIPIKYNVKTPFGQLRLGKISSYDLSRGIAKVELSNSDEIGGSPLIVNIPIPNGFFSNDGIFIGSSVKVNTPIVVGRGESTNWYFVSFVISDPNRLPSLKEGELLLQTSDTNKILLDKNNSLINIGSDLNLLSVNSKKKSISSTSDNFYHFGEDSRNISGIIKRDQKPAKDFPDSLKLSSDNYDSTLYEISLDPTSTTSLSFSGGRAKNPPFIEKREIVYEFAYSYNVKDDLTESQFYQNAGVKNEKPLSSRKASKADTLSLGLNDPNYLMETVKGTVVDIFGKILDINRFPIPIGSKDLTLKVDESGNIKDNVFNNIKEKERKSLAYHFEINARKDLTGKNGQIKLPDITSKVNYAKERSRFFLDIDKEGQFKVNVPASSETGNISLLTRYENFSTFKSENEVNSDKVDIFQDSFAIGDITINGETGVNTPKDRIDGDHIKHGTAYHSISNSFETYAPATSSLYLDFQYEESINLLGLPKIANIVSPVITTEGPNANGGGRSGSLSFDGSLEFNVGANTIDRQSIWLDTAGSIIGMVGRDKNNISAAWSLDGDLIVQIGGKGISEDSRFNKLNNQHRAGVLDIRVINSGSNVSIIRIDDTGVIVATPGSLSVKARDINISATGQLILEGDRVSINQREVLKFPAPSI
jgi:hypothetical protein